MQKYHADLAETHNRLARVVNAVIDTEAPNGLAHSYSTPQRLEQPLRAPEILGAVRPWRDGVRYASPAYQLLCVPVRAWRQAHPERGAYWEDKVPAIALQALEAAQAYELADWGCLACATPGSYSHFDAQERAEKLRLATARIPIGLANAAAILDRLESRLALANPPTALRADELPSLERLSALPPLARAIRAADARDAAGRAVTLYADVYGHALMQLKAEYARDNLTVRGWTRQPANALGLKTSAIDEALRRYRARGAKSGTATDADRGASPRERDI